VRRTPALCWAYLFSLHELQNTEQVKALAVDLQKTKDKKARSFSNLPL
jgi:hypothetical protein